MAFNEECLRRVIRYSLEPIFGDDGVAVSKRVAQPTMAAWMRVSKVSLSTKVSLLSIDSFDKKVSHHMSRVR